MSSPDTNPPITQPYRGALILVVERNPVVQRLERYFLEHAGFQVEFASDGIAAAHVGNYLQRDRNQQSKDVTGVD